ncbi:MAG: MATE family efflux transporter [Bacteroidales bacterium]|nr:MATE family efflux transporter [Candidatus Cacconaster scatequi]
MNGANREILRLAVPSILANITVPLVGMVDIAVAGHLVGGAGSYGAAEFIGGIAIGSLLFDLLYWNFGFLRISTGGLTAQAFGRKDFQECTDIFARSLGISLIISLIILLLQSPFPKAAFLVVKTSPTVKNLALQYFFIRIWAAPATLSLMVIKGWFVGMQDSFSSMFTDLVVNAVNIVASIFLTLGVGGWEGMGYPGIAVGTVIAQYSGLLTAVVIIRFKYRWMNFRVKNPDYGKVKEIMSMNSDLFIRSVCFIAIYIGYTTIAARYGDVFLSASTILMKLLMIFSYFTDGFAYSGEALTGRFIGERNRKDMNQAIKLVFLWSMGVATLFIGIYALAGSWMVSLMTSDTTVALACEKFLWWLLIMPPLGCAAFTWDGIYEGATATVPVRNAMILATITFFGIYFAGIWLAGIPSSADGADLSINAMNLLLTAYFAHLLVRTIYLSAIFKNKNFTNFAE